MVSDQVLIAAIGAFVTLCTALISRPKAPAATAAPSTSPAGTPASAPTPSPSSVIIPSSPVLDGRSRFWAKVGIGLSLTALALIISDFWLKNRIWYQDKWIGANCSRTVARLSAGTFVRFEGYTSENNFSQPFIIYAMRAYASDTTTDTKGNIYNKTPLISEVQISKPHVASSDVTWSTNSDGDIIITKGTGPGPHIELAIKPPEIFKGSVEKGVFREPDQNEKCTPR